MIAGDSTAPRKAPRPHWWLCLPALAVLILYLLTSLPGGFYYDDYRITRDGYGTTFQWKDFWNYTAGRPLTLLTYYANYLTCGLSPWFFHLTNILIHSTNVLLCGWLVWFLTGSGSLSVLSCLIFGFHFSAVEPVNYVWARSVLLSSTAILAGLCIAASRDGPLGRGRVAAVSLCFVLGFLARPDAVLLFPLLFLLIALFKRRFWQPGYVAFLVLLAPSVWLVMVRLGDPSDKSMGFDLEYDWLSWGRAAFPALLKYFEILVRPDLSTFCHPNPEPGWHLLPGFMVAAGLVALMVLMRNERLLVFGVLVVFAIPLFTLLIPIRETLADRRIYLAVSGMSFIWAILVYRVSGRLSRILGVALVCSLAVVTAQRNLEWSQPPAALLRAESIYPTSPRIKFLLGDYFSSAHPNTAIQYLKEALSLNAGEPDAATLLGNLYLDQGQWQEAQHYFHKELEHHPRSPYALNSLGILHWKLGKLDEAKTYFRRALVLRPDYEPARRNLELLNQSDLPR